MKPPLDARFCGFACVAPTFALTGESVVDSNMAAASVSLCAGAASSTTGKREAAGDAGAVSVEGVAISTSRHVLPAEAAGLNVSLDAVLGDDTSTDTLGEATSGTSLRVAALGKGVEPLSGLFSHLSEVEDG